jgi:hypothetical protein
LLDIDPEAEEDEEGSNMDADSKNSTGKCCVIKTSTRQVKKNLISKISINISFFIDDFPSCSWISRQQQTITW